MPGLRQAAVSTALALALALAAGCGGSSDTGGDDPLGEALAEVSSAPGTALFVTWVDTARLREAADLPDSTESAIGDERWRYLVGLAAGSKLSDQVVSADYGFDPLAAERTVEVGTAPDDAVRFDGVDTDSVRAAFEKLGYEEDGDFLALGGEGELVEDTVDEFGVGMVGLNRLAFEGDSFAIGGYEEPVAAAIGRSGDPVADAEGVAAATDCIGSDALAAQLLDPQGAAAAAVALLAVAIEAPAAAGDAVPEIVCAVGTPNGSLDEVGRCMEGNFNDGGLDPQTQQPYSDILGEAEIEEGESDGTPWVRARFEPDPDDPVGRVFQMVQTQALSGPLGGTSPEALLGSGAGSPDQIAALQKQLQEACSGG